MKFTIFIIAIYSINVQAHSGRTDSSGCHHERRTGGYHCHRSDTEMPKTVRGPASVTKNSLKNYATYKNKKMYTAIKN